MKFVRVLVSRNYFTFLSFHSTPTPSPVHFDQLQDTITSQKVALKFTTDDALFANEVAMLKLLRGEHVVSLVHVHLKKEVEVYFSHLITLIIRLTYRRRSTGHREQRTWW